MGDATQVCPVRFSVLPLELIPGELLSAPPYHRSVSTSYEVMFPCCTGDFFPVGLLAAVPYHRSVPCIYLVVFPCCTPDPFPGESLAAVPYHRSAYIWLCFPLVSPLKIFLGSCSQQCHTWYISCDRRLVSVWLRFLVVPLNSFPRSCSQQYRKSHRIRCLSVCAVCAVCFTQTAGRKTLKVPVAMG